MSDTIYSDSSIDYYDRPPLLCVLNNLIVMCMYKVKGLFKLVSVT